jgi:hypothetical protein
MYPEMFERFAPRRWSTGELPLDAAWSMQHIAMSVATWRRDVGVGENMTGRHTTLASCFIVSSLLLACAGHPPVTFDSLAAAPAETAAPEPIVLEVENHNWADVVLYVVHDGVQTRFTQVAAAHNISIEIPPRLQGQMGVIRIAARRIGGTDSFVSQAISLRGNSAVRVTIESSLSRSSVGVW